MKDAAVIDWSKIEKVDGAAYGLRRYTAAMVDDFDESPGIVNRCGSWSAAVREANRLQNALERESGRSLTQLDA